MTANATLPPLMQYIAVREPGAADVLHMAEGNLPVPADDEVLIRVSAAGVNRPDVLQRLGHYPPPPGASPLLGLEVAGEVVAAGKQVPRWQPGDLVCALVNGGGYAEYAVAPATQCLPVPAGLSLAEAAALPETAFTVWHNLWQRAALRPGETLLVHGGSSGIGTLAIQLAAAMGVTVYATAGSEEKCRTCEKLGAAKAINYKQEDFVATVKSLTDGRGVDVILDMVGGEYVQRNFAAAARDARLVSIAFLEGSRVNIDLMPVMMKRLTLTGSTLRGQSALIKAQIARELEQQVWPLITQGKVKPLISAQYYFSEAAEAHSLMESGRLIGKVVLLPNN